MENVEENEVKWNSEGGRLGKIEKMKKERRKIRNLREKRTEKAEDHFFLPFHFQETTETFWGSTKMEISTGKAKISLGK